MHPTVRRLLHGAVTSISGVVMKLMPDRIPVTFVGADATRDLCESIAHTGTRKILIVTDEGLVAVGIVARITDALGSAGVECVVYSGVLPDPTFTQVEDGLARLRAEGCDAVLAVGGGSSMDAAKVIAARATNDVPVKKLAARPFAVARPPAPLYAIPTTAGTGSEVTLAAVVSDPETHTKAFVIDPKLLPKMTALDPTLMVGLPPQITAATGMDALTHAVESYVSKLSTPTTEEWATLAVRLIFKHLPTACTEGGNLEARRAMALASYYAGLAFTRTNVGYVHAVAHTFGAFYGTPHGMANAIVLPHVLEFSLPNAKKRLAKLADLIGAPGATTDEKAKSFVVCVREMMNKIDIPEQLGALKEADIPAIARQACGEAFCNYPAPRYMSEAECEDLLQRIVARDAA